MKEEIRTYLEGLDFWDEISETQRLYILDNFTVRTYEKDSVIHARDNECLGLILLLEGRVRTFMVSEEGREITLYRMEVGETDVLSASCVVSQITFDTQMVADTDVRLAILPATYLSGLKEGDTAVRCFIFEQLASRFSDVMWTMQQILFSGVDARIATWLLDESGRTGSKTLHTTHEQIAKEISSAREVVARMMKRFAQEGLVKSSRGTIEILDRKRLTELVL